jgi:hypothetical protein
MPTGAWSTTQRLNANILLEEGCAEPVQRIAHGEPNGNDKQRGDNNSERDLQNERRFREAAVLEVSMSLTRSPGSARVYSAPD